MSAVLLTRDLMCSSRVAGAAAAANTSVRVAATADDLVAKAVGVPLVILDLDTPAVEVAALLPRLRALEPPPGKVIAFCPHVHTASLEAARSAGCDEVWTRGQFYSKLDEILRQARPTTANPASSHQYLA